MAKVVKNGESTGMVVELAVELGRTRASIDFLMGLQEGSLIELDLHSGEPAKVTIDREEFAEGEVVAVGSHFGVRITKVVNA